MENTTMPVQPTPVAPQAPMQPAPKSGHKVLWIILSIVGIMIILIGIVIFMIGRAVSDYVDVDNGQVSIKGDNGELITYGGKTLPANWSSDLPTFPGAEIKFSASGKDTDGKTTTALISTTSEPGDKVTAYYQSELAKQGWIANATTSANNSGTLNYTKDIRELAIVIGSEGGQTTITLAVVDK